MSMGRLNLYVHVQMHVCVNSHGNYHVNVKINASSFSFTHPHPHPHCATAGWLDLKAALPVKEVPDGEKWRLGLLDNLISQRADLEKQEKDTKTTVAMLSSLCST